MYKSKSYQARPLDQVCADIDVLAERFPQGTRVFLADGDALALPADHMARLLDYLTAKLPRLSRVSAYASPKNLLDKSREDLALLRKKGLRLLYFGIESGADIILKRIIKGASQKTHIQAIERAREADMKISATVILGLGGRKDWETHIDGTAALINQAPPTYLSTLQLMLEENSFETFMASQPDDFEFQDDMGILLEQERLISLINPSRPIIFRSNHASNCLALAGNLPRDQERLLSEIEAVRSGAGKVRPEFLRGL